MEPQVTIEWPNGVRIPVILSKNLTLSELLSIVNFSIRKNYNYQFTANGKKIIHSIPLLSQGIKSGDVIRIVQIRKHDISWKYAKNEFNQVLRLTDLQFSMVEGNKKSGKIFKAMFSEMKTEKMKEDEESNKNNNHKYSTMINNEAKIMSEPLPTTWSCNNDDIALLNASSLTFDSDENEEQQSLKDKWIW